MKKMKTYGLCASLLFVLVCSLFAFDTEDLDTLLKTGECSDCDLREVDFSGKTVGPIRVYKGDLSKSLFRNTIFVTSVFEMIKFNKCNLDQVNFSNCSINKGSYKKCGINGADFSGATVTETIFSKSEIIGTSFRNATVRYCDFSGCDLHDADFRGTDLTGTGFTKCDLNGVLTDGDTIGPEGEKGWRP